MFKNYSFTFIVSLSVSKSLILIFSKYYVILLLDDALYLTSSFTLDANTRHDLRTNHVLSYTLPISHDYEPLLYCSHLA